MTDKNLAKLALAVDKACDSSNEEELKSIIFKLEEHVEKTSNSEIKSYLYYYLSNAWSGLKNINNQDTIWQYEQIEVFEAIYYLRKAISESGFSNIKLSLQISIFTNLGNAFNHYGRTINAIKYYNKALSIHPHYFMSSTSKAICLKTYSSLIYDYSHKDLFLRYAYFNFIKANNEIILHLKNNEYYFNYYNSIKEQNNIHVYNIESFLTKEWLDKKINLNDFQMRKFKNEQAYRNWVLNNVLFLNPMNDLGNYSVATQDILNLPDLKTNIKSGFPKFITYFNQIKQEYITHRHLFYEGVNHSTKSFYNKDTFITDDYDYNIYDINTEKIKLAFRGFYSLFDKIAYFLNEYLELGLNENRINFKNIWNENKKLNDLENLALRGLYLISKDLFFNENKDEIFFTPLDPEAKKIAKIRNHLEHKFIMIKALDIEKYETTLERDRGFYITEEEFIDTTLNLAKLSREAIMYLSFSVHKEETKKGNNELYVEMPLEIM